MIYETRAATVEDMAPMMRIGHEGLRPYVEADRGWDVALEEAGFRTHFEIEKITIVVVDREAVGYYKLERHPNQIYLDGIYLSSTIRNQGLGATILKDLVACETQPLTLRVFKSNPAHRLYRRLGFVVTEETERHYYMASQDPTAEQPP